MFLISGKLTNFDIKKPQKFYLFLVSTFSESSVSKSINGLILHTETKQFLYFFRTKNEFIFALFSKIKQK